MCAAAGRRHAERPLVVGIEDLAGQPQYRRNTRQIGLEFVAAHVQRHRRMLPQPKHGLRQLVAPHRAARRVAAVPAERQFLPDKDAPLVAQVEELVRLKQVAAAVESKQIDVRCPPESIIHRCRCGESTRRSSEVSQHAPLA